jgi:hypothetical protein
MIIYFYCVLSTGMASSGPVKINHIVSIRHDFMFSGQMSGLSGLMAIESLIGGALGG